MSKPWQYWANKGVQLLASLLFIYVGSFTIGHAGIIAQLVLWPIAAIFIYWVVIRDAEPFLLPAVPQQDFGQVLVTLRLNHGEYGSSEERDAIHSFTDQLATQIVSAKLGNFDGDEFGDGRCTLFMYAHDPKGLYGHIEPFFRSSPLTAGATIEISDAKGATISKHQLP
jgi:hypothetical protein